jgi:hypothetical protein
MPKEMISTSAFIYIVRGPGEGSEPFPGTLLKPMKKNVNLQLEVLELLIKYYHNAYGISFVTLSNIHNSPSNSILVLPKVNLFARLRLGAEVFGSTFSPRYTRSANILAQFVLDDDNTTDTYPGQVQFFFEHTIYLPEVDQQHTIWHLSGGMRQQMNVKVDSIAKSIGAVQILLMLNYGKKNSMN